MLGINHLAIVSLVLISSSFVASCSNNSQTSLLQKQDFNDPQALKKVVETIESSISPELKKAVTLRSKSKDLNDWLQAKRIYESYIKLNPNDAIANYRFCEFHLLVNPKIGENYCEKSIYLIDTDQDKRFSSDLAKDLYISDISAKACNMALYNKNFSKAITYCERSLSTKMTQSDPLLITETEIRITAAKRQNSSVIILSRQPVCETEENSPLCK